MVRPGRSPGQGQPAPPVRERALRVVVAGTPPVALPSLRALLSSGHDVVAVVTRPDAAAGRGRRLRASPVGEFAAAAGIEVLKPAHPRDPDFLDRLRGLAPDAVPVVGYGALVPAAALAVPRHGWINLHFSVLPAWRGAAPVQHALLAGDELTGATTFRLTEGLDTGPVFGVVTERVRPNDTAGDLLDRLADAGADLLLATLNGIASGELTPRPQPDEGVSLAPKIDSSDARIDWSVPAVRVDRLVRACTPAPGAWTTLRGARLKLGPVEVVAAATASAPGTVHDLGPDGVVVGTGTSAVRLGEVRPEGRGVMAAADWSRGIRLRDDDRMK